MAEQTVPEMVAELEPVIIAIADKMRVFDKNKPDHKEEVRELTGQKNRLVDLLVDSSEKQCKKEGVEIDRYDILFGERNTLVKSGVKGSADCGCPLDAAIKANRLSFRAIRAPFHKDFEIPDASQLPPQTPLLSARCQKHYGIE